jgi:hypothetical protein
VSAVTPQGLLLKTLLALLMDVAEKGVQMLALAKAESTVLR